MHRPAISASSFAVVVLPLLLSAAEGRAADGALHRPTLAQKTAPPMDPSASPDEIAPLEAEPLPVEPLDVDPPSSPDQGGSTLVFKDSVRAKELCRFSEKTESYGCPAEDLAHFNVRSVLRVTPPAEGGAPLQATAVYDGESGCLLAVDIDFGRSATERRIAWKSSTLVVAGKETDFYVESSNGDVEPGWETGTLIVPNAPMKESIVERKGKCLIDLLDEGQSRDAFFVDIQIEEAGRMTKTRVEVERSWVAATVVEAARALPEPTEPLPSAYWPWIVGGLGVCGVGGLCGVPICGWSSLIGGVALVFIIGSLLQQPNLSLLACYFLPVGAYIGFLTTIPAAIVGLVVGLITGGLSGWGLAEMNASTFPDDKESDARWLAWRAFRQKHGVPMKGPKLDLPKKPSSAMAH